MIQSLPVCRLFAKSLPSQENLSTLRADGWEEEKLLDRLSLCQHLVDVYQAAEIILGETGRHSLEAVGLEAEAWLPRLRRVVRLGAAIHDLGKAGDQFQRFIRAPQDESNRQVIRHEWVTLLMLDAGWRDFVRSAIEDATSDPDEKEWEVVRWSVAGHHPKFGRSAPPEPQQGPLQLSVENDSDELRQIADWLSEEFGLKDFALSGKTEWNLSIYDGEAFESLHDYFYERSQLLFDDPSRFSVEWRRFAAVCKNLVVAADIAGSAIAKLKPDGDETMESIADHWAWLRETFDIEKLPKAKSYEAIVEKRLAGNSLRPFQEKVAHSASRVTLVTAGCGSGKTTAAYQWASKWCDGRRLWFCYPTTGTGTEGFGDYLADPELRGELRTSLVHSRRNVDFKIILEAEPDRGPSRLESLREVWHPNVVACTVDSVLGLIQNNRRGLFGWPALAQSGFVFDEIHSYDERLFSSLLHFLEHVRGVPVLLMTASLRMAQRDAIEAVLARNEESLGIVDGPTDLETRPRYVLPSPAVLPARERNEAVERIVREIESGGRVLVVCNTVQRAMDFHNEISAALKELSGENEVTPLLYHSRFKYADRVLRHKAAVDAFQQENKPAVAVCTQVAEMSLDIDATLLVTELAPVPALIQRLGRLNRRATDGDAPRPCVVIEPVGRDGKTRSSLPYEDDELMTSEQWLAALPKDDGGLTVSQRHLADAWLELDVTNQPVARSASAWLDYGPANPVHELREGSPNITVLCEDDVQRYQEEHDSLRGFDVVEYALPMPTRPGTDWAAKRGSMGVLRICGLPVATSESLAYCPLRGGEWRWA